MNAVDVAMPHLDCLCVAVRVVGTESVQLTESVANELEELGKDVRVMHALKTRDRDRSLKVNSMIKKKKSSAAHATDQCTHLGPPVDGLAAMASGSSVLADVVWEGSQQAADPAPCSPPLPAMVAMVHPRHLAQLAASPGQPKCAEYCVAVRPVHGVAWRLELLREKREKEGERERARGLFGCAPRGPWPAASLRARAPTAQRALASTAPHASRTWTGSSRATRGWVRATELPDDRKQRGKELTRQSGPASAHPERRRS